MTPRNLQAEWSRLIASTLADAGLTDVVLSPGSRSTPFVLAIAAEPRLRVHDVIDERVAGFMALGMARVTGRPAALLCTSGTAVAHYFPALIEAAESGVPLLVLSADRPPEVYDAAANQTIRQRGIFGGFVRWEVDLGAPEAREAALRGVRRNVGRAVRESLLDKPGPVHINAPARKPLEPVADDSADGRALKAWVAALVAEPVAALGPARRHPAPAECEAWLAAIRAARGRGLIACGPALDEPTRAAAMALAAHTGFPLLAEAASGLRFGPVPPGVRRIGAVDPLLRAGLGTTSLAPGLLLQVGRPLVCAGWERLAGVANLRWVTAGRDWPDPDGTAVAVSDADPAPLLERLVAAAAVRPFSTDPSYGAAWAAADATAQAIAARIVAQEGDALSEAASLTTLLQAVPSDALLVIGNSLPVRAVDLWVEPSLRPVRVVTQRGVSGIDGLVSGAAGAWRVAQRPIALVLGDVSLVHDLGGLQGLGVDGAPCVVLVLDNRGGRIFEQLPIGALGADVLPHFLTTPNVRFADAAAAFGLPHGAVTTVTALQGALRAAFDRPGASIIQAIVPPHGAADHARQLAAAVSAALQVPA